MDDDWECSICLDSKKEDVKCHDCGKHWFHKECLKMAMEYNSNCPVCRYVSCRHHLWGDEWEWLAVAIVDGGIWTDLSHVEMADYEI